MWAGRIFHYFSIVYFTLIEERAISLVVSLFVCIISWLEWIGRPLQCVRVVSDLLGTHAGRVTIPGGTMSVSWPAD